MTDKPTDRTVEELRAAATKLRGAREFLGEDVASWSREFLALLGSLVAAINPLADWLEEEARQYDLPPCNDPTGVCNRCEWNPGVLAALAVARAINGGEPRA